VAKPSAILLLGPTGAGKTPLGLLLEHRGLWGRSCHHFDFGAQLRRTGGATRLPNGLQKRDLAFVRAVLTSGALLDDEHVHIAAGLLRSFIAERQADSEALIVLNGLPRHVGQASGVDNVVEVQAVAHLTCPAEIVLQRIRSDAGGDRRGRNDDAPEAVQARLRTYAQRTLPLLDYYRHRGTPILPLHVEGDTGAEHIWRPLDAWDLRPA